MAEPGDDDLSRRYRALSREEPPAALDAAILASSRRAVDARPGGARRWAGPVSIAAVLVLGVGVTLRMQQERPGIETSTPQSEDRLPDAKHETPAAAASAPPEAPKPPAAEPAPTAKQATPRANKSAPAPSPPPPAPPVAAMTTRATTSPLPPPAAPASAPLARRDPAPEQTSHDFVSERGARDATGEVAVAPRAKREAASANEARAPGAQVESPGDALERIARLRAEGRHADADRALEEFQRTYRGYRIPEAMWERVRPR